MKEIELFYLTNCPYCRNAEKAIGELLQEDPDFGKIAVRRIEESREPEAAAGYDYYYVPSFFYNGEKLYEAQPGQDYETIKANVRRVFSEVLKG